MDIKKIVGLFVVITLIVTFVPKVALAEAGYSFIDEVGNVQTAEDWIPVTADTATLSSGWYVVNDNITRNGTITVSGNAKLILADGCTLTVIGDSRKPGIAVTNGNSLTIYGQSAGTGALHVQGSQDSAGIGAAYGQLGGTITINGGNIHATGGQYGAGIGGGHNQNAGITTITGGIVTAIGGQNSAGIGGAYDNVTNREYGSGGTITITGGNITAIGNGYGAGIGGGLSGQSGNVSISGGIVNATSGSVSGASGAAGIGGGAYGGANKIIISGGTIVSTSLGYGAGIGGGDDGSGGIIEISGGEVTARSDSHGAGIGGGWGSGGGTITINDGKIIASAIYGGAGIGGGWSGSSGTININGGDITANGGNWGAGIGGGGGASCNTITITGGVVSAFGDKNFSGSPAGGAGIGSGGANAGGTQRGGMIKILGGKVFAQSAFTDYSDFALDIGRGRNGINGEVWIDDEAIVTLGNKGTDPSVTNVGTCVIKGSGGATQTGVYENGTRITPTVIDLEASTISNGPDYSVTGNLITLSGSDNIYALVGTTNIYNVTVASGKSADVILFSADIAPTSGCAFKMTGATVNMRLMSRNRLSSGPGCAGIQVPIGSELTIAGSGSLSATGGSDGAGIGGGNGQAGGIVSIKGGIVDAIGQGGGTGVGGGNGSDGGTVLVDGKNTVLTATGGVNGQDIGSGNSQISGGSLTVQNHATLIMTRNRSYALKFYITGTVAGAGSQLDAGQYLDSHKLLTCVGITPSPDSGAKAYDMVDLTAHVTGLSDTRPQGVIVFYDNGSEIGRASLNRVIEGSDKAMAMYRNWEVSGGTHLLRAEYIQDPGWDSYFMPETESLIYEVARIEQSQLNITGVPESVTYGDAPFPISVSGGNGSGSLSYAVTEGDAVSVDGSGVVTVTKAGIATVTVTKQADNNYDAISADLNITVNKATPPTPSFPSAASITYGETLSDSALTGGSGDGTFAWESPDELPIVNNNGYPVVFTPNDPDNYDYADVTQRQTVNITVKKATPAVVFPTAGEITYEQSLADSVLTGGNGQGTFSWETPEAIPTVVNSGYSMVFTPNDTNNFITLTETVAVSVHQADQSSLSVVYPTVTYGDSPFPLSISGGNGSGSLTYAVTEGDTVSVSGSGVVTVLKAGESTITVTKTGDSNYNPTSASVNIIVDRAKPTVTFPRASSITYGQSLSNSILTDGIGDGSFAWESPDTIPEVINDGFPVVFTPDDMENYQITEKTIKLVVDRAIQSPLTISGIPDSLTFRDAPFHLTVQGGSGTGMISYAVTSGNALEIDSKGIVTIIHGGAATITVTKSGDDNYLPLSHPISFTVNKAAQATALTYELPESVAYGDKPFAISGGGGDGSGTIDYFVTQGDALAVNKKGVVTILRPGEAVIILVKADDLDYLSQTMALRLKVNQAVQDTLVISGIPAGIRMGDAPFKLKVSGGGGIGALSYSVSSGNVISVNKSGLVSVLNEGTAYLTVTKAEDENYLAATLTVEIEVDTAPVIEETPSISPTPSPKDTVVSKPEAAVEPKVEATDEPGPATTTPPLSADTTSPQVSPSEYAKLDPVSIQTDEETDKIVIAIDLNDLSEGVTSIQMPSGEIIPLDTMRNSLELSINRSDINQAGELILVGLGQETIPIDRFTIDLSDDEQSDSSNNSVNVSLFLISLVTGLLILGGAMTAMIISSNKKK